MRSYDELKEEFDRKVKELREKCDHSDVTDWIEEYWAPAHSNGCMVKICNICKKEVARDPPKDDTSFWSTKIAPTSLQKFKK